MSPENATILFFVGGCVLTLCLMGVIVAAFFGVGSLFVSVFFKKSKAISKALADDTDTYFARVLRELLSWQTGALADFSSELELDGRAVLGELHYRGTVRSYAQHENSWLVFEMLLKRLRGVMRIHNSRQRLELHFDGPGDRAIAIQVDGYPFGSLRLDGDEIGLFDEQERLVGVYRQQKRPLGLSPGEFNLKAYYGPVELNGYARAELNRNPLILRDLLGRHEVTPFLQNVSADLRPDEELWLLALVAWEIRNRIVVHV